MAVYIENEKGRNVGIQVYLSEKKIYIENQKGYTKLHSKYNLKNLH